MTALTRRTLGKWLGSAAAFLSLPFQTAGARPLVPQQKPLARAVQDIVDGLSPEAIQEGLFGPYNKIFRLRPSTMQIERTVHIRYNAPADMGQRWVYNAEPYELAFGFAVVADDDPRAGAAQVLGLFELITGKATPCRLSQVSQMLPVLLATFRRRREVDAAAVLNSASTYNPFIGGDGKALLSPEHPHEDGAWPNTFDRPQALTAASLEQACAGIRGFVDNAGVRIMVRPVQLIVGSDLAEQAEALSASHQLPHRVWDHLSPGAWFVQSDVDGLAWFERVPFEIAVHQDWDTGQVYVYGFERRCFTHTDPRAVFGCIPHPASQGI